MPTQDIRQQVALALEAVNNKKAEDVALLQLPGESSTFTDYFLICSGSNPRQVQAIADEVDERLSKDMGVEPNAREGYNTAEWILLDYVDFVVHVFLTERRAFYDIERLRKSARPLTPAEFDAELTAALAAKTLAARGKAKTAPKAKKAVKKVAAKKAAAPVKAPAKKAKAAPAKKAPAKKVAVKKAVAKKAVVKKAVAKKKARK